MFVARSAVAAELLHNFNLWQKELKALKIVKNQKAWNFA